MTHIEQMIQDMCPHGVEFKTLGEVCDVYTGGEPPADCIKTKAAEGEYIYPIYSNGVGDNAIYGFAKTYTIRERAVTFSSIGTIGHPTLREGKFTPIIRLKVIIPKNESILNISFLKYALDIAKFYNNKSSLPNINAQMLKQIEIPLPPLEIQERIVAILDRFSALAAELQAELQMRRKQYEYYRTQLLTPHSDCNSADKTDDAQWEWKTLGEVCDLVKDRISALELDTETYVSVENLLPNKMGKIASTSVPTTGNVINYHKDNVLIGNIRPYLRKIWLANCDGGTNGDVITLSIKDEYKNLILPRFLYHALADERFFIYDTQYSSGAKMPRGDKDKVMEYQIALPPLAEQARIVSILDKFEALTTSLSDGIPAEQAAQQKRYEYYRDKLLTFEKRP